MLKRPSVLRHITAPLLITALLFLAACTSTKPVFLVTDEDDGTGKINDRTKIESLYINGIRARSLGDTEAAVGLFSEVLKLDAKNDAANYELARLYFQAGDVNMALPFAERAAELDPENIFYIQQLADMLMVSGQMERSAEVFEQLIELAPGDPSSYFQLAFINQQSGNLDAALKAYKEVESKFGPEPSLLLEMNRIYMVQGKLDQAAETLERVIELSPDDPQHYEMLAKIYQTDRKPQKAAEVYEKLLGLEGDNPALLLKAASIYRMKGDYESYHSKVKEAFASDEVNIDSKIAFLVPFIDSIGTDFPSHDLVFELNESLVSIHSEDPKAHAMYGDFLYYDDRKQEARNSYLNSLRLEKNIYDVWRQVISIDLESNTYDSLEALTSRAIEIFPNQPANYYFNGYSNMQLKRYDDAIRSLKLALPMTTKNPRLRADIYSALGDAYHNVKNHDKSDEAYDACLRIDPENQFVLNNYSYYLSLRGKKLEKAAEMAAKANELSPGTSSFEDTYAWVLFQLGKYDDARIWQEKALNNGGRENGVQLDHYGDILFKLGETENAVEYWKKAREHGMDSEVVDRKIADRKLYE